MSWARKKTIGIFLVIYLVIAVGLFTLIKKVSQKFDPKSLVTLTDTVAATRSRTEDLCYDAIKGDPIDVGTNYIKINFWCRGKSARSTMALGAVTGTTVGEVLKEYARIIGFDYKLIEQQKWICYQAMQKISDFSIEALPARDLDCYQDQSLIPASITNP